jgi:hypothetical protein
MGPLFSLTQNNDDLKLLHGLTPMKNKFSLLSHFALNLNLYTGPITFYKMEVGAYKNTNILNFSLCKNKKLQTNIFD